jgi:cell division protein FtsQ
MQKKRLSRWMRSFRRKSREELLRDLYLGLSVVVVLGLGWGIYLGLALAGNSESLEIRNIQVMGERRVTENEILARAGYTPGMNALEIDLGEIREAVEAILWVRHATVRRVWPNELVITVSERLPVALARIDGEIFQVDVDGMILPVDDLTNPDFPVLDGIQVSTGASGVARNAVKIGIYLDMLDVLGESQLSEVHVSETGDVSVVPVDDAVVVDLGLADHRSRWEKYLSLKARIREDYPTTLRIDLRFRDQVIIQTEESEPAERIIWDDETKLL